MFIEIWLQGIFQYLKMASARYLHLHLYCTINLCNCHNRLLILVFLEIFSMKTTIFLMEGRFQSSGQLQRPFTIASTPLPVMSGAMDASSMRYGHWDTNHFMILLMLRQLSCPYYYLPAIYNNSYCAPFRLCKRYHRAIDCHHLQDVREPFIR